MSLVEARAETLQQAASLLREGRLVAFPTETVYGLGADATNDRAVASVFAAKGRPHFNPLIVHAPDLDSLAPLVVLNDAVRALAARFWPGPLTLVLPRAPNCPVSLLASAGLETLAVRVPAHPVAQGLLRTLDRPIAAPSANASGRLSPTRAAHVAESLGDAVALILEGGPCAIGLESTVLDLSGEQPALLRPGAVTRATLQAALEPYGGLAPAGSPSEGGVLLRSPGLLASHYAPRLPVRLNAREARPDEAFLTFGPAGETARGGALRLNLSPTGDLVEAAARLFASLRELDQGACAAIAVMPVPDEGLGEAINDRLRRAAAPRD